MATAVAAQDKPGVAVSQELRSVVTIRDVDLEHRTVTVERPDGQLVTINVPKESQNLDPSPGRTGTCRPVP